MKNKLKKYLSFRILLIFAIYNIFIMFIITSLSVYTILYIHRNVLYFVLIGSYLVVALQLYASYMLVYKPYLEHRKLVSLFVSDQTIQGIFEPSAYLSPEQEEMLIKFKELININEMINATKRQAHYLALQNQINPHFLYNTLEGIRGEALSAGLDSVAQMTEALATYFRYTISNLENLVTLEDELVNIDNYYIIQQYRFGDRIHQEVDYNPEDEILKYKLPKLTLQPIVENAIYHGIEPKMGKGIFRIKIVVTSSRLLITVSDDGIGITEERLNEINQKLHSKSLDYIETDNNSKGGIAIVNVNNRIKLLFGEEYGINIYSTLNVGTDVEITLPLIRKDKMVRT